jgi:hypothetical protein
MKMIRLEFRPAMRLAFLLMPTDWMYIPIAVFFSTRETTMMQTAEPQCCLTSREKGY